MPSLLIEPGQIKGLIPAVDRRVMKQPYVLDGKNFYVDAKGPISGFGNRQATYARVPNAESFRTFRVEGEIVLCVDGAILQFDSTSQTYYPIYEYTPTGEIWPWTHAKVGFLNYFCNKGFVLEYNHLDGMFTDITASLPTAITGDEPRGICRVKGRLIVAADEGYAWSALDDGSDLAASLVTGAGAQSWAIVGGEVFLPVPTNTGFLVWGQDGAAAVSFSDGATPFIHETLSVTLDKIPLSPFCITSISAQEHVVLGRSGLYRTTGNIPLEAWQPLMSEYFKLQILRRFIDVSEPGLFKLHYNPDRGWFFISIGSQSTPTLYREAYMLYFQMDEWGYFKRNHYGFGELYLDTGPYKGFNFGFICLRGHVHGFVDIPDVEDDFSREVYPYFFWRTLFNYPRRRNSDNQIIFPCNMMMETLGASAVFDKPTGLFDIGMEDFQTPIEFPQLVKPDSIGLNSSIDVGLFRWTEQEYPDELGLVTDVAVGFAGISAETIDWLTEGDPDVVVVDWLAIADNAADEDWGEGLVAFDNCKVSIIGTNDGENIWEDQEEELTLVKDEGKSHYYTCNNNGIWHIVRLEAAVPGQSFHLNSLGLSGIMSGRLV